MALPGIIRYFRDCYEADNRRAAVWNVFHPSVEHRIFIEGKAALIWLAIPARTGWLSPSIVTRCSIVRD